MFQNHRNLAVITNSLYQQRQAKADTTCSITVWEASKAKQIKDADKASVFGCTCKSFPPLPWLLPLRLVSLCFLQSTCADSSRPVLNRSVATGHPFLNPRKQLPRCPVFAPPPRCFMGWTVLTTPAVDTSLP